MIEGFVEVIFKRLIIMLIHFIIVSSATHPIHPPFSVIHNLQQFMSDINLFHVFCYLEHFIDRQYATDHDYQLIIVVEQSDGLFSYIDGFPVIKLDCVNDSPPYAELLATFKTNHADGKVSIFIISIMEQHLIKPRIIFLLVEHLLHEM
ncbi:hypothetical protein JCM10914A_42370 [Paenibacillus sp. JCM 10914]